MPKRKKKHTGSGKLHQGKLPVMVLECVCSWEMAPKDLAEELHTSSSNIWRALCNLRSVGFVVQPPKPIKHNTIVRPTEKGRQALKEYTMRIRKTEK